MNELAHIELRPSPARVEVSDSGLLLLSDYSDEQEAEGRACASPKFYPALKSTACTHSSAAVSAMTVLMFRHVGLWLGLFTRCLQSHRRLLLENLALRQQLAVLKRKHPRPRMGAVDKIFWVFACRFWVRGSSLWCSSILRQSLAGIALVFDCTGV